MTVEVIGPDQKRYQFPDGTDKATAVAYFRKKGIGATAPVVAKQPAKPQSFLEPQKPTTSFWDNAGAYFQQRAAQMGQEAQRQMSLAVGPEAAGKPYLERASHGALSAFPATAQVIDKFLGGLTSPATALGMIGAAHPATRLPAMAYFATTGVKGLEESIKKGDLTPENVQNFLLSGSVIAGSTTGVKGAKVPKVGEVLDAAIKHELNKAKVLNIRALKPEDMAKPTGEAVAKAKIWGRTQKLPGLIRKQINQNNIMVNQAADAATQSGARLDLKTDLQTAIDTARRRPAFMGDKRALGDITDFEKRLSTPINPQTGTPLPPRQWNAITPNDALELSRGLEKPAGWEGSAPEHIQKLATDIRQRIGDKLDSVSPGIAELRKQNSGLIEAEKSATKLAELSTKEQIRAVMHWLSQPSLSKLVMTAGMIEIIRESGMVGNSYLLSAGGAMGLRALAESMTSRTGRAMLHQHIAELLMGLKKPTIAGGGLGPNAPPTTPRAGPQGPVTSPTAGGTQPVAGTPPVVGGTPQGASPVLQAPISQPDGPAAVQVPQLQQLTAGAGQAAKTASVPETAKPVSGREAEVAAARRTALAEALPKLQEVYDFAKSGWERSSARRNIDQIKAALEKDDVKEMGVIRRRLKVAEYRRAATEKSKALAPAPSVQPGATRVAADAVDKGLTPEQHVLAVDEGYQRIAAYGSIEIGGETVDAKLLVKQLQKTSGKLPPEAQLAAIAQVLEFLEKSKKGGQ